MIFSVSELSKVCLTFRILIVAWVLLSGCGISGSMGLEERAGKESIVLAFIHVETKGPYFRRHQTEARVRFFDIKNIKTGEWARIPLGENAKRFVTRLAPGRYELFRIQIGEGPFRSESYVNLSFDVQPDKTMYLGSWQVVVDSPKTVRMLQLDALEDYPDGKLLVALQSEIGEKSLVVSLPQPVSSQSRLFAVAPSQPRAKYFYRR